VTFALLALLAACGEPAPEVVAPPAAPVPEAAHAAARATAGHPAYGMVLLKIDALVAQMGERQAAGEVAALPFPAEQVARHGRLLLTMTGDLPPEARADLTRASATLDALSAQIAQAAGRGDAARTAALLAQYRLPLAALRRYRP